MTLVFAGATVAAFDDSQSGAGRGARARPACHQIGSRLEITARARSSSTVGSISPRAHARTGRGLAEAALDVPALGACEVVRAGVPSDIYEEDYGARPAASAGHHEA